MVEINEISWCTEISSVSYVCRDIPRHARVFFAAVKHSRTNGQACTCDMNKSIRTKPAEESVHQGGLPPCCPINDKSDDMEAVALMKKRTSRELQRGNLSHK